MDKTQCVNQVHMYIARQIISIITLAMASKLAYSGKQALAVLCRGALGIFPEHIRMPYFLSCPRVGKGGNSRETVVLNPRSAFLKAGPLLYHFA